MCTCVLDYSRIIVKEDASSETVCSDGIQKRDERKENCIKRPRWFRKKKSGNLNHRRLDKTIFTRLSCAVDVFSPNK